MAALRAEFRTGMLLLAAQVSQAVAGAGAEAAQEVPVLPLVLLLVVAVALLLVLILKLKLQAFLALLLTSVLTAAGASFINPSAAGLTEVGANIVDGMGSSLGFVATIIGVGAIFGAVLEHSQGTQALAQAMLRIFGIDRASWAMLLTGFIVSIPVFLDVGLVILTPLLRSLSADTGRSLLFFGLPLAAGMATTHAFVPPTPGPVAVAYFLGVNLGYVILFGLLIALPTAIICGPVLCGQLAALVQAKATDCEAASAVGEPAERIPEPAGDELTTEAPGGSGKLQQQELPRVGTIIGLIALPILLIMCNTLVEQCATLGMPAGLTSSEKAERVKAALSALPIWQQLVHLFGHPVVALLLSTLLTLWVLGTRRGTSREHLLEISTQSLGPAGIIILVTGAGGVFKKVLGSSGITVALAALFADVHIPLVIIAWIFAVLIRIAQGSATVAMLTAAGLMSGFTQEAEPAVGPARMALIACAIASGATACSHVNDSGFWMVSRYFGLTEKEALKTWTVITSAISLVSFSIILLLNSVVS